MNFSSCLQFGPGVGDIGLVRMMSQDCPVHDQRVLGDIDILPRHDGGKPCMSWMGVDISDDISCSISHSSGTVAAAIAMSSCVGVDVEQIVSRTSTFVRYGFMPSELAWMESSGRNSQWERDVLITFLWTLKEAAYKSVGCAWRNVRDVELHIGTSAHEVIAILSGPAGRLATIPVDLNLYGRRTKVFRCCACHISNNHVLSIIEMGKTKERIT
jgi:phosphopantetheinyl transferase (holo-ACP synthase)